MFVKEISSGDLIRVEQIDKLINPFSSTVIGHRQAGEEEQEATEFAKDALVFPSGESLPECWSNKSLGN